MTTNAWVLHPDNHGLPEEDLPVLKTGESGESYGWPPGLLGPQSTQRLQELGITTTSLLIRIADQFDAAQWKNVFGGKRDGCERSVWPTRYAGVQEYLQRARKVHAAEYERRRHAALQAPDSNATTGRTTDAWAIFADTFKLPVEEIPRTLRPGESGGTYGWPNGMMGKEACERLHAKGITRSSQLMQMALSNDHDQFRQLFGGAGNVFPVRFAGAHLYLVRCVTANRENTAEYQSRLAKATKPIHRTGGFEPVKQNSGNEQDTKTPHDGLLPMRELLHKNSIPEGVGFTAILLAASMLAAVFANDFVFSQMASFMIISIGLRFITLQALGRCACLATYAVLAQMLVTFTVSGAFGYLAFCVCVYVSIDHFEKIPPTLIPAFLR